MGKYLEQVNTLFAAKNDDYLRPKTNTNMPTSEWRTVEMAEEFAQWIKEGNSMFRFPYFRQLWDLWGTLFNAYSASRRHESASDVLKSEYMAMILFVVFFTSMELTPKALTSLVLARFLSAKNPTEMQRNLADFYEKYANDLQTIPFYDHNYKEALTKLSAQYEALPEKSWVDRFSWNYSALELWTRIGISKLVRRSIHNGDETTVATTDVLVKYRVQQCSNVEDAKKKFKELIAQIDPSGERVSLVGEDIEAKIPEVKPNVGPKTYTCVYARLRVPRYAASKDVYMDLDANAIHLRKIAGQDNVQVKFSIKSDDLAAALLKVRTVVGAPSLYDYGNRIDPKRRVCFFSVPINNLQKVLKQTAENQEVVNQQVFNY